MKAYQGQTIRLRARLRDGMRQADCAVYSAVGKVEPSPHVPLGKLDLLKDGRPVMVSPTMMRLTSLRTEMQLELVADEDSHFFIMQDVDVKGDPLVKARIKANDRIKFFIASALRRFRRNR